MLVRSLRALGTPEGGTGGHAHPGAHTLWGTESGQLHNNTAIILAVSLASFFPSIFLLPALLISQGPFFHFV